MPSTPQTILTVTAGGAPEPARALVHGAALQPFGVGTQGAWAIFAPGVELVHFFIGFDGTQVHVAKASPSYPLSIAGVDVGQGWHVVPVPCELRFGGACVALTFEEQRLVTQPFERSAEAGNRPVAPGGPIRTQFIARPTPAPTEAAPATPMHGFVPVQPTPHHVAGGQAWTSTVPIAGQAPQPHAFGATVPLRNANPAFEQREPPPPQAALTPGYAKVEPARAVVLGYGHEPAGRGQGPQAHVQVPPHVQAGYENQPVLAPSAPTMHSAGPTSLVESSPRTLGDGGALREHAARVAQATPSAAFASAQAYVAEVQRASGNTPPPGGSAEGSPAGAPRALDPAVPPLAATEETAPKQLSSKLLTSFREASLVKKLTVALLPFGLVGVVLMPDEPAPAERSVQKHPAASSAVSGTSSSRPAGLAAGSVAPSGADSAGTVRAGEAAQVPAPSAGAVASGGAVAASGLSPTSAAQPSAGPATSAVPLAAGTASGQPVVALLPTPLPGSAAAEAPGGPSPLARDAVYAAFEGRSAAAAKLYEQLASAGGDRVFALAARLAREDQVRKPVISH